MEIIPQIFNAKVMHKRFFPSENQFTYGIYYLALPLSKLLNKETKKSLAVNKRGLVSFRTKDHGSRKDDRLEEWAREILATHDADLKIKNIVLVTMPRVLGYSFNPVSFWFCLDENGKLRAVICEVNNTFGETHSYLCIHPDAKVIRGGDWLKAGKVFHVSPFLERQGEYRFRFSFTGKRLGIWIDYFDHEEKKQLITSLTGKLSPLTRSALRKAFWQHPLVTLKAIALIHWQALKLFRKRVKYNDKPKQKDERLTIAE